ncbi:MAG: exo-alpha-sialidase [Anaerolineales bacterium]|nr:exo-alpha-sialidase [Anaerolineales bacterium]
MSATPRPWRPALILTIACAALLALTLDGAQLERVKAKGLRRSSTVLASVANAAPPAGPLLRPPAAGGFSPQVRLGFTAGDQWEPAIAADRLGHVYVLYPQYLGVPGCPPEECASPTMILQRSADHGASWSAPTILYRPGAAGGQWDAQIVVDPQDGRTVFASWLQNGKSDTVVAKSTDFGATWTVVTAEHTNAGTDKPILAVRGQAVAVVFNHAQKIWAAVSRDGGLTFTQAQINPNGKLGWALSGGGTITSAGLFFAWAGYEQNGGAKGNVNLFVSRSADGGQTWTTQVLDVSKAPPDCSAYHCGWAYLGAQMVLAADQAGGLYALWNANSVDKGPNRVYFARSTDGGLTWSPKSEVSTAPAGRQHAFPALAAGAAGDVRVAWMDTRAGTLWNTFYRSSTDGGRTWSAEADLATYVAGYTYIAADGFSFPFGDYFEMDLDERGTAHVVWGEALNYDTPGSIWYAAGR